MFYMSKNELSATDRGVYDLHDIRFYLIYGLCDKNISIDCWQPCAIRYNVYYGKYYKYNVYLFFTWSMDAGKKNVCPNKVYIHSDIFHINGCNNVLSLHACASKRSISTGINILSIPRLNMVFYQFYTICKRFCESLFSKYMLWLLEKSIGWFMGMILMISKDLTCVRRGYSLQCLRPG